MVYIEISAPSPALPDEFEVIAEFETSQVPRVGETIQVSDRGGFEVEKVVWHDDYRIEGKPVLSAHIYVKSQKRLR